METSERRMETAERYGRVSAGYGVAAYLLLHLWVLSVWLAFLMDYLDEHGVPKALCGWLVTLLPLCSGVLGVVALAVGAKASQGWHEDDHARDDDDQVWDDDDQAWAIARLRSEVAPVSYADGGAGRASGCAAIAVALGWLLLLFFDCMFSQVGSTSTLGQVASPSRRCWC